MKTESKEHNERHERRGRKAKPGSLNYIREKYACIKEYEMFYNLSQSEFKLNPEQWYNLNTNRAIKVIRGKTFLIKPRVVGNPKQLHQFILINNIKNIIIPDHLQKLYSELSIPKTNEISESMNITISSSKSSETLFNNSDPFAVNGESVYTSKSDDSVNGETTKYKNNNRADFSLTVKLKGSHAYLQNLRPLYGANANKNRQSAKIDGYKNIGLIYSTKNIIEKYPQINEEITITNLSGKDVKLKPCKWYNLETSRSVGNVDNRLFLIVPRITGNFELLTQYLIVNNIDINNIIIPDGMSDLEIMLRDATTIQTPRVIYNNNIDDIPFDEIDRLQTFKFSNITVPAIITNIIDGDTFDCAMVLDPMLLALPTTVKNKQKTVIGQTATICYPNIQNHNTSNISTGNYISNTSSSSHSNKNSLPTLSNSIGLLIKLRIRLHGVDAADCIPDSNKNASNDKRELMKGKKIAATEFVKTWGNGSDNKIWLELMGYDCRSRILGKIYQRKSDGGKSKSDLSSQLLRYRHKTYGQVAVIYDGGNKNDAWDDIIINK